MSEYYSFEVIYSNEKNINIEFDTNIKKKKVELTEILKNIKLTPRKETNEYLETIGLPDLKDSATLYNLVKRPEVKLENLTKYIEKEYSNEILEQVEINIKYEGYIKKALEEANKMVDLDNKKIPEDIDYEKIHNLASEAKQKLSQIRPTSIGQALRISGVNPADVSLLMVYIKKEYFYENR